MLGLYSQALTLQIYKDQTTFNKRFFKQKPPDNY